MKLHALRSRFLVFAFLIIAVGFAGFLVTYEMVMQKDREKRSDLLLQANLLAQAIHANYVKTLSGMEGDRNHPQYFILKNQIHSMQKALETCRDIYILGQKPDGRVFTLLDSATVESAGNFPTRPAHPEELSLDRNRFLSGNASVEGPFPELGGARISAMVPIRDKRSGSVVAMLGMDMDASTWNRALVLNCVS